MTETISLILMAVIFIPFLIYCIIQIMDGIRQAITESGNKEEDNDIDSFLNSVKTTNQIKENKSRYADLSEEEYKIALLEKLDTLNSNIIYLQSKQEQQNKQIKNVKKDVSGIHTILLLPIIIGIIAFIVKIAIAGNVIDMFKQTDNKYNTTVHVTDNEGNTIPNDEYHEQNVDNTDHHQFYETDIDYYNNVAK